MGPGHGSASCASRCFLLAPLVILVGAVLFYLSGGRYEETDNACLKAGLVAVSPNVAGRVTEVAVRNNQRVRQGDILFRIDPAPYQAAVDEAAAQLAAARTEAGSLQAKLRARAIGTGRGGAAGGVRRP